LSCPDGREEKVEHSIRWQVLAELRTAKVLFISTGNKIMSLVLLSLAGF
jgi:hypothetical protein